MASAAAAAATSTAVAPVVSTSLLRRGAKQWSPTSRFYEWGQVATVLAGDITGFDGRAWIAARDELLSETALSRTGRIARVLAQAGHSEPWEAWLSDGFARNPFTATWTKVVKVTTLASANPAGFGAFSAHGPIIVMGEYGPKIGTHSGTKAARHVYLSREYGKTWTLIFDLLTDNPSTSDIAGMHLHCVAYDPYWDRIWISWGDAESGILFSDDPGET